MMDCIIAAAQLVVQEALERTMCFFLSTRWPLTPITTIRSAPLTPVETTTLRTDPRRCFFASSALANRPVDSRITSAPVSCQGIRAGSVWAKMRIFFPSTVMEASSWVTVPGKVPCTESYFMRKAKVLASVMSLMATTSRGELRFSAALRNPRPMRPNPLIAIFMTASFNYCIDFRSLY